MQTSQQTREAYRKLPQKIREIIVSSELREVIESINSGNTLNEGQSNIVSEVINGYLMNMNDKESMRNILTKDLGVDGALSQKIFGEIENKILNNLDNIYSKIMLNINQQDSNIPEKINVFQKIVPPENTFPNKQQSVGQSFEQIILNQAKAMQPAVPENLPIANGEGRKVHDYGPKDDPYREPVE